MSEGFDALRPQEASVTTTQTAGGAANRVRKNCSACYAPIRVRLADHKRGWGRFCDKSCAAAYKAGMRPSDVNAGHMKHSVWAHEAMLRLRAAGLTSWPTEPTIKEQVGKVKVRSKTHSPCRCWTCGEPNYLNGPGLCVICETDATYLHPFEDDAVQGAF